MSNLETKILRPISGNPGMYAFYCPGCRTGHIVWTEKPNKGGHIWSFNGDIEKPTFRPSLLVQHDNPVIVCHSFVTDGKIQYLNDCTHNLKGQTVDMKPF